MARPALSATRSMAVLDFLAAFPDRSFTLSEIAKAAKINVASCHAVLNALVEQRYLARDARQKAYALGPALVAIGQAALQGQPLVASARAAAEALVAEHGFPLLLSTLIGEEILCVVSVPDEDGRDAGMKVGERRPLVPPVGAPFLAWADDPGEVDRWLALHTGPADEALIAEWRRTLEVTRARGFQVTLRAPGVPSVSALMDELAGGRAIPSYKDAITQLFNSFDYHMVQPEVIEPGELYDLTLIAAPIFDRAGRVAFNLCMGSFRERLPGSKVLALADSLVRTCLALMREDRARA